MVQSSYEHGTPSIQTRINSIKRAVDAGLKVRVCFDPLLADGDMDGMCEAYTDLIDRLFSAVEPGKLHDVSLGEFRVPCDYLKRMRKKRPASKLLTYPFTMENGGFCCGEEGIMLAGHVEKCLSRYLPQEKIYRWR